MSGAQFMQKHAYHWMTTSILIIHDETDVHTVYPFPLIFKTTPPPRLLRHSSTFGRYPVHATGTARPIQHFDHTYGRIAIESATERLSLFVHSAGKLYPFVAPTHIRVWKLDRFLGGRFVCAPPDQRRSLYAIIASQSLNPCQALG